MFLAFPFSEVVCLISAVMTWLYIGLGFIGDHHITNRIEPEAGITINSKIQPAEFISSETSRCFCFENQNLDIADLIESYKSIVPVVFRKNIQDKISATLTLISRYVPNRAPPVFS